MTFASIPCNFLSIRAEEVGGWCNLGGINFCIWKFGEVCDNNFLFYCEELVKIKKFFVSQFLYDFLISL